VAVSDWWAAQFLHADPNNFPADMEITQERGLIVIHAAFDRRREKPFVYPPIESAANPPNGVGGEQ